MKDTIRFEWGGQSAMSRAFIGLWMLGRDGARKDYAKLALAASRGR